MILHLFIGLFNETCHLFVHVTHFSIPPSNLSLSARSFTWQYICIISKKDTM